MGSTTSKGFKTYSKNDLNVNVGDFITGDATDNMVLANKLFVDTENAIDNKITIGGEAGKQNFNFIADKVEMMNLIDVWKLNSNNMSGSQFVGLEKGNLLNRPSNAIISSFGMDCTVNTGPVEISRRIECLTIGFRLPRHYSGGIVTFGQGLENKIEIYPYATAIRFLLGNNPVVIRNVKEYEYLWIFNDGKKFWFATEHEEIEGGLLPPLMDNSVHLFRGNYNAGGFHGTVSELYRYDKILSPQERQNIIQVLNNSHSLISMNDYAFATDSNHVVMDTGYNSQQFADSVMDKFKATFTSTGEDIIVNNGFDKSKILNASVSGNTVKVLAANNNVDLTGKTGLWQHISIAHVSVSYGCKFTVLASRSVLWTIEAIYTDETKEYLTTRTSDTNIMTFTAKKDIKSITLYNAKDLTTDTIFSVAILDGEFIKPPLSKPYTFGLTSTQATITNNGQSYTIYEPMIVGKTSILKAPKGTQNWVEIRADEARDTAKFDYKLESLKPNGTAEEVAGLPSLGSVPSVADVIDRDSGVVTLNTKEDNNLVDFGWIISSYQPTDTNFIRFESGGHLGKNSYGISSGLEWMPTPTTTTNKECIGFNSTGTIFSAIVLKSKLSTQNVNGFKQWLQTNPVTVRYQLATPQQIQLTQDQLKAYDAHKKQILLPFAEDKFNLNEDGSGTWVDESETKILDGTEKWINQYHVSYVNTIRFYFNLSGSVGINDKISVYCKQLPLRIENQGVEDTEGIWNNTGNNINITIRRDKLETQDVEGFKKYLSQNNIEILYRVNPTVTSIPKSLIPTIPIHKTNIFRAGESVKPSTWTVVAPTTDKVAKAFELSPINSWTGTGKSHLLKSGECELVLDIAAPGTYNTLICNIPVDTRPSVERKVIGLNGDTPVVITISTNGEVRCATTITGSVKVKATYEK